MKESLLKPLSQKFNQELFYQLLRIRIFEQEVSTRYSEQQMRCPVHLSLGQEAIAVGVCHNLNKDDIVFSAHRAHAHYLAKGGDMTALLAELYGKKMGCSGGKGGSMHLIDLKAGFLGSVPILGSTIPIAVGAAFGNKIKGQQHRIVTVFFGDGATESGVFYESLNFAALHRLPVLFVCENNQISVKTKLSDRRPKNFLIPEIAKAFTMETFSADGQDCINIFKLLHSVLEQVRLKASPVYLEFKTERYAEHCGPKIYENQSAHYLYGETDPVILMKKHIDDEDYERMEKEIIQEVNTAFSVVASSDFPEKNELYTHIYKEEI